MKLKEFEFHSALFLPVYKFSILDIKLKYSAFMLFDWLLLNFKSKLGNNDAFMYIYTFRRKKLQRNIMFTAMAMHLYSSSLTHVQIILHSADFAGDEKKYLQFLRCLPSWVQKLVWLIFEEVKTWIPCFDFFSFLYSFKQQMEHW